MLTFSGGVQAYIDTLEWRKTGVSRHKSGKKRQRVGDWWRGSSLN